MHLVSVILPCFNPPVKWAENILIRYKELQQLIDNPIEVVLVQDGNSSNISDKDIALLKSNIQQFNFISYPDNMGKGYALRQGVNAATGDIILYTDIDFPYTISSIEAIYFALKNEDIDMAIGVKDSNYYKQVVLSRRIISKFLRWLIRTFLSMPVTDTQCGLKGFNKKGKELFLQTTINRYLFDLEFIRAAFIKKYKIKTIPVILNSNINITKTNYRILIPEFIDFIRLLGKKNE